LLTNSGQIIRLRVNEISLLHRSTQGIKLMDLTENETIVGVVRVERGSEEDREDLEITTDIMNGEDLPPDADPSEE
ncbi:MAG TPA: DNA gyrase C-terminal beta-propeller domain-containing protein, partial [Syntrophales bacterium]|nr:DNA gyrase C-terminal beta-propeller domain-containing protein [Syntrophales bacterium]